MDRKLLGKRIREERMRIGLTQEQIAEYIDVSTTYIGPSPWKSWCFWRNVSMSPLIPFSAMRRGKPQEGKNSLDIYGTVPLWKTRRKFFPL